MAAEDPRCIHCGAPLVPAENRGPETDPQEADSSYSDTMPLLLGGVALLLVGILFVVLGDEAFGTLLAVVGAGTFLLSLLLLGVDAQSREQLP
jgi:hypothetical protein